MYHLGKLEYVQICQIFTVLTISLETVGGISPSLHGYIVGASLRASQNLMVMALSYSCMSDIFKHVERFSPNVHRYIISKKFKS